MPSLADGLQSGEITLRSNLQRGRDFKERAVSRGITGEALRALRLARLPNWVWTVEAHRGVDCEQGSCVVAEIVYDSTSADVEPICSALLLPGVLAVYPPDGGGYADHATDGLMWRSRLIAH